jgi:hypothetical protein
MIFKIPFMNRLLSVAIFLLYSNLTCFGQSGNIEIRKKACGSNGGYKLFIYLKNGDTTLSSNSLYELKGFTDLSDNIKLAIVEELLKYGKDTSKCCLRVSGYLHNYIESCKGSPKSSFYTIQIDALFMINRLCFSNLTDLYSCHPVLYDTLQKTEINNKPELIKHVYSEYRKWFEECKAKDKIEDYFPFNDGRFVWYGGSKSKIPKKHS